MKMNRLFITSALLLSSLSALGIGVASNTKNKTFSITEMNANTREVLRAQEKELVSNPVITPAEGDEANFTSTGDAINVSKATTQIKVVKDENGLDTSLKTMRFVAAVNIGLTDDTDDDTYPEVNDGGQFGFHIKFNDGKKVHNINADTSKYYMSIQAGDTVYRANNYSKLTGKTMDEWVRKALGEENTKNYNAFITMEIRNIPAEFTDYIEAQPYFYGEDNVKHYAEFSKKSDTSTSEMAWIYIGDQKELMEINEGNRNERMYVGKTDIPEGTNIYIENSYGQIVSNYKNKDQLTTLKDGVYTTLGTGKYQLYYNFIERNVFLGEPTLYFAKIGEQRYQLVQHEEGSTEYGLSENITLNKGDKVELYRNSVLDNVKRKQGKVNLDSSLTIRQTVENSNIYWNVSENVNNIWVSGNENYIYFRTDAKWHEANARFALCFQGTDQNNQNYWISLNEESDGLYSAVIPNYNEMGFDWKTVCVARMNPGTSDNNWENKWNESAKMSRQDFENNFYADEFQVKNCISYNTNNGNNWNYQPLNWSFE